MTTSFNGALNEQFYIRTADLTISWLLLLLLLLLEPKLASVCVCVWVSCCLCDSKQKIRKHWWRRYDKLDAIVYTIQIDVHMFLLLFMTIPYLPKAIKFLKQSQILYKLETTASLYDFSFILWDGE